MKTKKQTLPHALGITNEDEIIEQCLVWNATEEDLSTILKKIMCSEYNSKEMLFASYCVGKMQGMEKDKMNDIMMLLTVKRIARMIDDIK